MENKYVLVKGIILKDGMEESVIHLVRICSDSNDLYREAERKFINFYESKSDDYGMSYFVMDCQAIETIGEDI